MKKAIILIFLFLILSHCSVGLHGPKAPEAMLKYEQTYDVANLSKNELFSEVNSWFVNQFLSSESVIEYSDKETGRIVGKYTFTSTTIVSYKTVYVLQTVDAYVKENKVRLYIHDPNYGMGTQQYTPLVTQNGINQARQHWIKLSKSLKQHLDNIKKDW